MKITTIGIDLAKNVFVVHGVDERGNLLHICVANLLISYTDSLVGYKYILGIRNEDVTKDLWEHAVWNKERQQADWYRIAPKRLAEPRSRLLGVLHSLSVVGEA